MPLVVVVLVGAVLSWLAIAILVIPSCVDEIDRKCWEDGANVWIDCARWREEH